MSTIERKHKYTLTDGENGFSINFADMKFEQSDLDALSGKFAAAHEEMKKLEAGAIKNPDENRQVTHFSDRIAYPKSELFAQVEKFAQDVIAGDIVGSTGKKLEAVIINGIGGSALGPQLMQFAINGPYWNELSAAKRNGLKIYFLDNTDSAGFRDVLDVINPEKTLMLTISKSGGTQETKNNLTAMENYYRELELDFSNHAAAITMRDSKLWKHAEANSWSTILEMAESIGGRTSETSIVGHVPAVLTGIDFKAFLDGAATMDEWTRKAELAENPAYMMAAMWYIAGSGKGDRNMVIVPYSDRLILMSRYFQQLVMESIGKELDLDGNTVHQGINVFGNKGGTDAHAFIQQLNDGRDDFFVTFIEVLKDAMPIPLEDNMSMGDYLHGFQAGLVEALCSKGRQVIQMQIDEVSEFNLGMIIALYERAVAVYAELIHINAFHQPGVQAYKLAANGILKLREDLMDKLMEMDEISGTAGDIAAAVGMADKENEIGGLLDKAAESCPCDAVSREWCCEKDQWVYTIK